MGFEIALVLSSLTLSLYSFRLFGTFFKGGIFGASFLIFGIASLLFSTAYAFDLVLDLSEIKSAEFYLPHYIMELLFMVVFSYGVRSLYKAWTKLERVTLVEEG